MSQLTENESVKTIKAEKIEMEAEVPPALPDVSSKPQIRETSGQSNLIDTAVKFLQNPRLASSPLNTKKAFLKSKGLSDEQINEACAKAGVSSTPEKIPPSPHANYPLIVQNPQTTWLVRLRDAANVLVICGGLAGALWYLWKNYLEPWMLKQQREDPLKESLEKLANSVSGLEETLSRQKTLLEELVQRSYAVEDQANWKNESAEIKSEIISLKGLFLSSSRFPSNPPVSNLGLPDWQLRSPLKTPEKNPEEPKSMTTEVVNPDLVESHDSKNGEID